MRVIKKTPLRSETFNWQPACWIRLRFHEHTQRSLKLCSRECWKCCGIFIWPQRYGRPINTIGAWPFNLVRMHTRQRSSVILVALKKAVLCFQCDRCCTGGVVEAAKIGYYLDWMILPSRSRRGLLRTPLFRRASQKSSLLLDDVLRSSRAS